MVYPHTYRTEHSETKTTSSNYGHYFAQQQKTKIHIQPQLLKILQYIDSNNVEFLNDFKEVVAIKSVSGDPAYRKDMYKMKKYIENWLIKLGVKYECFNIGFEDEAEKNRLPPVILGTIGNKKTKKTVCVYAHVDVTKPDLAKWRTDPWTVVEVDKVIFGNGVSWGKGDLLNWFHVIQAFNAMKIELPVTVKFIIESLNRQQSRGLEDFLMTRKQDFLCDIDYVVCTDSEWLGEKIPCVSYGMVGVIKYRLKIEKTPGSKTDPKDDLMKLSSQIVDSNNTIKVPKLEIYVQQITPDEEEMYSKIDFNIDDVRDSLPDELKVHDKVKLLMHFWRLPSIVVGDLETCICDKKDVSKVQREFVFKIVPNQIVDRQISLTKSYINKYFEAMATDNKLDIEILSATRPWLEDCASKNYEAARRACIQIYKEEPSMIREDRHLPCINILFKIIRKNILLLPLGNKNVNSGKTNECMAMRNLYEGTKVLAAYLFQAALV